MRVPQHLCIWLWLGLTPVLGILYLTVPVSPDQALFDYIAWMHLNGEPYYSGAAEQNWPGKMLIHELGIRLFGVHFWTFRLIDFLILQAITIGGTMLLRQCGFRWAPWVFLILYPPLYVSAGEWTAGQRDIVAAGFLVIAAAFHMAPHTRSRQKTARDARWQHSHLGVMAGVFIAGAVLIRPTYLSYLAGLLVLEWLRFPDEPDPTRPALGRSMYLLCGFLAPFAFLLLAGLQLGNLGDFYEQTVLFNTQVYQVTESRLRLLQPALYMILQSWHWIAALAMAGLGLWLQRAGLVRGQVLILGLIATVFLSYFAQNKGFGYHLGGLLPAFCLLIAILVDLLGQWRKSAPPRRKLWLSAVLYVVLLLSAAGSLKKLYPLLHENGNFLASEFAPNIQEGSRLSWAETSWMVDLIRANSAPDDYILQWGRAFEIGYLAERRSSLRFISTPALTLLSPSFSGTQAWLSEVERDLDAKRPAFIVISRRDLASDQPPFLPHAEASEAERMVVESLSQYTPVLDTPTAILFRLQ